MRIYGHNYNVTVTIALVYSTPQVPSRLYTHSSGGKAAVTVMVRVEATRCT